MQWDLFNRLVDNCGHCEIAMYVCNSWPCCNLLANGPGFLLGQLVMLAVQMSLDVVGPYGVSALPTYNDLPFGHSMEIIVGGRHVAG